MPPPSLFVKRFCLNAPPKMVHRSTKVDDDFNFYSISRKELIDDAIENAKPFGKIMPDGHVAVYVNDADINMNLTKNGLKHGLDRRLSENGPVTKELGEILSNAVLINELTPEDQNAAASYVLLSAAIGKNNNLYIVRFVVDKRTGDVEEINLHSVNTKKESAALNAPGLLKAVTDSTISIAHLLDYARAFFADVFSEDVLIHYGYDRRPKNLNAPPKMVHRST